MFVGLSCINILVAIGSSINHSNLLETLILGCLEFVQLLLRDSEPDLRRLTGRLTGLRNDPASTFAQISSPSLQHHVWISSGIELI